MLYFCAAIILLNSMSGHALGLIETKGLIGAISACDAAAKAAQVTITSAEVTDGGLVTLKIAGDLAAVRASVEAGSAAAEQIGELITAHVIARPDDELTLLNPGQEDDSGNRPPARAKATVKPSRPAAPAPKRPVTPKTVKPTPVAPVPETVAPKSADTGGAPTLAEMQKMPVVKLRQFARAVTNLPIQGRQISMANKTKLIEALKTALGLE